MLVQKEQCVSKINSDDTLTPCEVILADKDYFLLGEIYALDGECTVMRTDIDNVQLYPNDGSKTLEEMNLIITE